MLDLKFKLFPSHTSDRAWMEPAPLGKLFWNVTYRCNFHCPICFTDAGSPRPGELTTGEARAMLVRARAAGVSDIIISGGEPFARPDLLGLLAHMAELGITARIATNGSLLSDEVLDRLRRDTLAKSFQVSLDTLDPELYAEMHGAPPGLLDTALRALRGIRERGFHTTIATRLTPRTLPGIPALLDRAAREGWSTVTVHLPVHTQRSRGTFAQDADMLGSLAAVYEHFRGLAEHWLVEAYIPWAPYHPAIRELARHARVVHAGCRAGRDRLAIQPDGSITPCVCLDVPAARVGDVRRDDLAEVFRTAPLCRLLQQPWGHGVCAECPNVRACGGGCRAAAFALTGRLDGQDLSCPVWQRRGGR
jgi:radical SAM protein with 4Fe4S-binding SPASM domain